MAASLDVPCPSKFDIHGGSSTSLGTRWNRWRKSFTIYLSAAGITDVARKQALLLHCAGADVQEIFETLTITEPTENNNIYQISTTALDTYFQPKVNKRYERHNFRSASQKSDESIDQYVTRLHTLSKTCEFHDPRDEIVDQVIEKCSSSKLRKRLLREPELSLDKLLQIAQTIEAADSQAKSYQPTPFNGTG